MVKYKRVLFVCLLAALCWLIDSTVLGHNDSSTHVVYATLLGALVTGAGVQTSFAGQSQLEQYILLGDVDTANALRGLTIEVDNTTYWNIANSAALMNAIAKWQMEFTGTIVGLCLQVATGRVKGNTSYLFTNDGVTTPNIFVTSEQANGAPLIIATTSINANSFQDFDSFLALFMETPANVDYVQVEFWDGSTSKMLPVEVDAWFARYNQTDANGRLGSVSVLNNSAEQAMKIRSARVYTNGTGACVIAIAKIPQGVWNALRNSAK